MGVLRDAKWQPLSDAGAILAGAKAYWYRTGTSTLKNTYSDKALSSANANPVEADANGRFGAIFGLEDEGYRLVLKTSADVTIYTIDEQFASAHAVDEKTRRKEIARSPFDHSAVGDGSTDDATALAAALAAADGVLDLEGKTYRCDSALTLRSGVIIRNGKIDFSNASLSYGFVGAGAAEASPRTFTAISTSSGRKYLSGVSSITGLAAQDMVRIRASDTVFTSHKYAELFRVESASGTDVYLDGQPVGTYTSSPFVEEITTISDFGFENVTITSPSGGYAIDLSLCERVRLSNVVVKGTSAAEGVRILSCYDVTLDSCTLKRKIGSDGCGIIIGDACRDVTVDKCRVEGSVTGIEIGDDYGSNDGICKDIKVVDCTMSWCATGVTIAAGGNFVCIEDSTFDCDAAPTTATAPGISLGGSNVTLRNNTIRNCVGSASRAAILINFAAMPAVAGCFTISGNSIFFDDGTGIGIDCANTGSITIASLVISKNVIHKPLGSYIDFSDLTSTITSLFICENDLNGGTGTGYAINVNIGAAAVIANSVFDGNTVHLGSTYTDGILISNLDDSVISCDISNNVFNGTSTSGSSATGININETPLKTKICGNKINYVATGINAAAATANSSLLISGNSITLTTAAAAIACVLVAGDDVTVSNNQLFSSGGVGQGIDYNGVGNHLVISNNLIKTDDDCIEITTSAAGSINYVTITGNSCLLTSATSTIYVLRIDGTANGGTDCAGVVCVGNTLVRSGDDGLNTTLTTLTGTCFVGCVFKNGTYAILIDAPSTEACTAANVYTGQATGDTSGTFDATDGTSV